MCCGVTEEIDREQLSPDAALQRLSSDHRCLVAREGLEESIGNPACFRIETAASGDSLPRRIDALHVTTFGRFGNLLVQIGHALDVAQYLGVSRIYYDVITQALGVFEVTRPVAIDGIELIATSNARPRDEKTLVGTFWSLHLLCPPEMDHLCKRDLVLSGKLYALLSDEIRHNLAPLQATDIVAHYRGGDIFQNRFSLDYVQPPFAFYRKSIEILTKLQNGKVYIVCEDKLNPAVDATIAWLEATGRPFEVHSGELKNDLKVMFAAYAVVASYGTFVSAVMKLSPNIRTVFAFDNGWIERDHARFRSDVELRRFADARGLYTKHGEWQATEDQIALIVTYDSDSIVEEL